jgi:hypothetical protein
LFITSSCFKDPREYRGDYPELYSVAVNTLLGVKGIYGYGPVTMRIEIIEEDAFGRKMFLYYEGHRVSEYSLHIIQAYDEEYVYFYPYFNFISAPTNDFTNKEIEELKRKNDWNRKLDYSSTVRTNIVTRKSDGLLNHSQILLLYNRVYCRNMNNENPSDNPFVSYFVTDSYGRSVYRIYSGYKEMIDDDGNVYDSGEHLIMIFNPDGSFDEDRGWFMLNDLYNYQEDLKQFMESNNWNQPYE